MSFRKTYEEVVYLVPMTCVLFAKETTVPWRYSWRKQQNDTEKEQQTLSHCTFSLKLNDNLQFTIPGYEFYAGRNRAWFRLVTIVTCSIA